MVSVIRFRAPNTPSGNPRRVFVAFRRGSIMNAWDEGYMGEVAIPHHLRERYQGFTVDVSASEYKALLKRGKDAATYMLDQDQA